MNLKQIESTLTTFVHNPRPNKEPMDKNYRVTCPLYHNELKKFSNYHSMLMQTEQPARHKEQIGRHHTRIILQNVCLMSRVF